MAHKLLSDIFVDDEFKTFDNTVWTVSGDAGPTVSDQNIRLTKPQAGSEGRLMLRDGLLDNDVWYMNANFVLEDPSTDPAEVFAVWFYADTDNNGYAPAEGYGVEFDHKNNIIKLVELRNGVRSVLDSRNEPIKDNTTGSARINSITMQWANGSLHTNINNELVLDYDFDFEDLNVEHRGLMFSAKTGSAEYVGHAVDDIRIVTPSELIFDRAKDEFDNQGIYSGPDSNTRRVMRTLLSGIESLAIDTRDIKDAHHIKTAHGKQLDRIGQLVGVRRNAGENDKRYRLRIILGFRLNAATATFDELAQFMGVLLDIDPSDLEYTFDPEKLPCTMLVGGPTEVFSSSPLTPSEIRDFAGQTIEAGHRVTLEQIGTFIVIDDSDPTNDPETGLTSDADLTVGGTLSADI